jgi:O-antigen ligase
MTTAQKIGDRATRSLKDTLSSGLDLLFIPVVCFVLLVKCFEIFDLSIFILAATLIYFARGFLVDRAALGSARLDLLDVSALLVVLAETASYAASAYPANSLHYLAESLFLFLFYCLVRFNLNRDYQRVAIFAALLLLGFWVSARALYSFWNHYDRMSALGFSDPTDVKHLFGLVGPDNYTTTERITLLLLLLPFPLILFLAFERLKLARLLLLAAITILLALSVTFSRAVYVATFAFILVASFLFYRYRCFSARRIALFNIMIGIVVSLCLIPVARSVLTTLSMVKTESQVRSVEGRLHLWSASGDIVKRHPLAGIGANNFPMQYTAYTEENSAFVVSAFSYFLQILVERGAFGLLAYSMLILAYFRASARSIKTATSGFQRTATILLMASVAAVIVRDLTFSSIFINKGANALLWFVLASTARRDR